MGSVVSGDLNLVADAGVWKNAAGTTIAIGSYKVVPGDTLTYTQPLNVTLTGDLMKATLVTKGLPTGANKNFEDSSIAVTTVFTDTSPAKKVLTGDLVPGTLVAATVPVTTPVSTFARNVNATTTFTFKTDTQNRSSVNSKYDFNAEAFGYKLAQVAPANAN